MKTTIELPDDLLRQAKVAAAQRGITLQRLFRNALERHLSADQPELGRPAWKNLAGELAPLRAETRRVGCLIEEEFEQIDTEDQRISW